MLDKVISLPAHGQALITPDRPDSTIPPDDQYLPTASITPTSAAMHPVPQYRYEGWTVERFILECHAADNHLLENASTNGCAPHFRLSPRVQGWSTPAIDVRRGVAITLAQKIRKLVARLRQHPVLGIRTVVDMERYGSPWASAIARTSCRFGYPIVR